MRPLPLVGVAPTKYQTGAENLADKVPTLDVFPFEEAFSNAYSTDAHFVTYIVVDSRGEIEGDDEGTPAWPRCNTPLLPKIRAKGGDILSTMLVFDYDLPEKACWTKESYDAFLERLYALDVIFAREFTYFYTTRHGARLVYVLDRPMPVDRAALLHRGVVGEFRRKGLVLDEACSDWTRFFRLPSVERDGEHTSNDPCFDVVPQYEYRLDASRLTGFATKPGAGITEYAVVEEIDSPMPTYDQSVGLLQDVNPSTGTVSKTEWYRSAQKRLKNRACFPCIFGHDKIAEEGGRDATLQRYVGEAVSLLYYMQGTSPELIFALFAPAVSQLEPDEGTPDWMVNLWDKVRRIWAREDAKCRAIRETEAEYVANKVSLIDRVVEGVRMWCDAPEIHGNDQDAAAWLSKRLVACSSTHYFVMNRTGQYDPCPVNRNLLVPRIRELQMEPMISLEVERADGKGFRSIESQEVVNRHGTIVSGCEGVVGGPFAGIVRNISKPDAKLVTRLFYRKSTDDLPGQYDPEVDEWLYNLFGAEGFVSGCEWIGHALAVEDGPICALSVSGPPGVGKKLLVQGLAECFNTESVADSKEFGQFQAKLMETCVVSINEAMPPMGIGDMDPADVFRQLVGGNPLAIDRKFREVTTIRNPCRVVFTANNRGVIQILAGKRDLSPEDRDALSIRLLHYDVLEDAARWLRIKGGAAHTARAGRRWIRGDAGQASDYVVAKHFMWLYGQRTPPKPGNRLLVEGTLGGELLREMTVRTNAAPAVVETLVKMIETPGGMPEGLTVHGRRIFVTTSAIVDAHRRDVGAKTHKPIDARSVASVLRGMTVAGAEVKIRIPLGGMREARWFEVDPEVLLGEAKDHGYACKKLELIAFAPQQKAAA